MKSDKYVDDLRLALEVSKEAAEHLINNKIERTQSIKNDGSIVTPLDFNSQDLIINAIKVARPNDTFLAEEKGIVPDESSRVWTIDPLDGTENYACGIPLSGINISLAVNGITVVSVTRSVFQNECISRIESEPFEYSGNYYRPGRPSDLILIDSFKSGVMTSNSMIEFFKNRTFHVELPTRSLGSAAIAIMYVILGRAAAYFAPLLRPWDIAPGLHFVAGNENYNIVNLDGSPMKNPIEECKKGFGIINASNGAIKKLLQ
jgi:myo-inositol-1(or 4)-monophosphatase